MAHPRRARPSGTGRLPPLVHIAGTSGKGSTIAFMRAILEAAGLRVHRLYLAASGALQRTISSRRHGGRTRVRRTCTASDDELADALAECERANAGAPITVFEITTAAGLLLFARHPADILLLEVGLGGRLDATNVIERPLVTVVAPVSLDHAEFLGDTVGQIAAEKAGIFKPEVPAIVAAQPREALAAIERQAARVGAPIKVAGEDWSCHRGARPSWSVSGRGGIARSAGSQARRPPPVRERRLGHCGTACHRHAGAAARRL